MSVVSPAFSEKLDDKASSALSEELADTADTVTAEAVCGSLRSDEVRVVIRPLRRLASHDYCGSEIDVRKAKRNHLVKVVTTDLVHDH